MATVVKGQQSRGDVITDALGMGLANLVESGTKGYQNRADEMAIQKTIEGLSKNADPRTILDALVGTRTYSPESKQKAIENYMGVENLNIAREKSGSQLSPFEKKKQEKEAEDYFKLREDKQKLQGNLENLDYVDTLIDELGTLSPVKSLLGTEKAAELEGVSFPLIESIVKLFNPSGPIAEKKLKQIADRYQVKASDFPWRNKGKVKALRRFADQALKRVNQREQLYEKYNGSIPKEVLADFNKTSNEMLDAFSELDVEENKDNKEKIPIKADPSKFKNKEVEDPKTGKVYWSDGVKWMVK